MKLPDSERMGSWRPPNDWLKITTIDAHTEGEPLRIIIDGFPEIHGDTILARRRYVKEHLNHMRTALMWEPRGHRDMYGCIITSAVTPQADFGVLFTHNEGYSTMCGHGIIGVAKVAVETGFVPRVEPETILRIDTPAGLVTARVRVAAGEVGSVQFENVPSFVAGLDQTIDVSGLGTVRYDLAFGGAFYAYVDARQLGLTCSKSECTALIEKGMAIKSAIMQGKPVRHPFDEDLSFLYGTIFVAPLLSASPDYRNVCIFAEGQVDRSPTGTGVSGLMTILHARDEIEFHQSKVIESIIGSRFTARVVRSTKFGPHNAVIPEEVEGNAFITGRHEFLINPRDPLKDGFLIS